MTSTKKSDFRPPSPCPHVSTLAGPPLWMSTYGRHEIHIALLKRLVQWPSGAKAQIRLYYCNLFKTVILVIYITNIYLRKFSTFYSAERWNSSKKDTNFFAWDEDRMTSVDSIFHFLCGRPHGLDPLPRPNVSTWAWLPPPCGRHKWMAPYSNIPSTCYWKIGKANVITEPMLCRQINLAYEGSWLILVAL